MSTLVANQWPWSIGAGIRWILMSVVTGLGMAACWWVISGEGRFATQVGIVAITIALALVSASSHVSMVLQGRRRVGMRRQALLAESLVDLPHPGAINHSADDDFTLVAVADLPRFHRTTCPMTTGRSLTEAREADHRSAGRVPCGICQPREVTTT